MDPFPIIMALAGVWNLFLLARSIRRGHTAAWFGRHSRLEHPAAFWVSNSLIGAAGLLLIIVAIKAQSF
jgi:hypothetical protein